MSLTNKQRDMFVEYAKQSVPNEACALLVLRKGELVLEPVANVHHDPTRFFRISKEDLVGKEVVGIVHSHPASPCTPSLADKASCNRSCVPWFIYSVTDDSWGECLPTNENAPLLGRPFVYGVFDCYTLIKDYFWQTLSIRLPDLEADYGFWNEKQEPYLTNFAQAGFFAVRGSNPRKHDCVLMQYASRTTNHAGVLIEPTILMHHTEGNLSCTTPYGGYWMEHTREIVRHVSQC